jgi:photosystem II stability/assembly factor-like uncharacterized protein
MGMKSLAPIAAAAATILIAAGCGHPGTTTAGQASGPLTSAPLDAALVTPTFGYVVTANQVLLTTDGGASFHAVETGLPPGLRRAGFFSDAQHGWVASTAGQIVSIARTADGGLTWQDTAEDLAQPLASVDVSFNGTTRGAVMARIQTGGSFSAATLLSTSDGGATWIPHTAPIAGAVSVDTDGRIWLAGGAIADELFSTTDQGKSWTKPALKLPSGATVDGVGPPRDGVLPITLTEGGVSRVALLRSPDGGASWQETASLTLSRRQRGSPPVSVSGQEIILVDRGSGHVMHRMTQPGAAAYTRAGTGLPGGVAKIRFVDTNTGWALTTSFSCTNGKQGCSLITSVVSTSDGGTTWRHVLSWADQMN